MPVTPPIRLGIGAIDLLQHRLPQIVDSEESALGGAIQASSGIAGSAPVGRLADGTAWPLGLKMALAGLGSFACTRLLPESSER